jgi:hypothetical protein
MAGEYDKVDASKDTGDSSGKVSEAWHDARDHSGVREGKDSEHFDRAPSWTEGRDKTESGISFFPKGKEYASDSDSSDSGDSGK